MCSCSSNQFFLMTSPVISKLESPTTSGFYRFWPFQNVRYLQVLALTVGITRENRHGGKSSLRPTVSKGLWGVYRTLSLKSYAGKTCHSSEVLFGWLGHPPLFHYFFHTESGSPDEWISSPQTSSDDGGRSIRYRDTQILLPLKNYWFRLFF